MTVTDAITAISALAAASTFLWGVNAWRREFIGRRRIELVENVLASFYEVEDAIREIRNPFSFIGEGKSRKRSEQERSELSELFDRAYIVFERYEKRKRLFAELRSMKYRVMVAFGHDEGKPFEELAGVLNDIFRSAQMLGREYWPKQGKTAMNDEQLKKYIDEMEKHEAVFWYFGEDQDTIGPRVRAIVNKVESLARKTVSS